MKKISTLLALFLMTLAFSQDKTYTTAMDSLLSHVDKSTMTTGILYDRIFPISDLQTSINTFYCLGLLYRNKAKNIFFPSICVFY